MTMPEYLREHGSCPDDGPICVEVTPKIDLEELMEFIKDHPEKLVSYMSEHISDDDMQDFNKFFCEFAMDDPWGGTTIKEWRAS